MAVRFNNWINVILCTNSNKKQKYDAILVLGTSTKVDLFKDRVEKAVALYKKGFASKIIFVGRWWGGLKKKPPKTEARYMYEYVKSKGVPRKDIFLEERSLNTFGNFYFVRKQILELRKYRKIAVITHKAHFPKAKFLAKKVLGRKYKTVFVPDDSSVFLKSKEHNTLNSFKKLFPTINKAVDGDMEAMRNILKTMSFYRNYKL